MGIKRVRGKRYPVEYVASELGVDRKRLIRCLEENGIAYSNGVTFREAFDALTAKSQREADRSRRLKAEADSAEMIAAEKRGALMLKEKAVRWFADFGTFVRAQIMGTKLSEGEKKRICTTIAEWEPGK